MRYYTKAVLYSTLILLFIGCSGKSNFLAESKQAKVLQDIQDYVTDVNNSVRSPQIIDYQVLGFSNLNEYEVANLNNEIQGLKAEDVDTKEEIKELIRISKVPSPLAYDKSVSYLVGSSNSLSITLDADPGDVNDTLTYSIETQPEEGTVSIVDNIITYVPNEKVKGYDFHDAEQTYDEVDDYPSAKNYYDDRYDNDIDDNVTNMLEYQEKAPSYSPLKLLSKLEDNSVNFTYKVSNGTKTSNANIQILARNTEIPRVNYNHIIWFNGTGEELKTNKHLFSDIDSSNYTVMKGWGLKNFSYGILSEIRGVRFNLTSKKVIDDYIVSRLKGKREAIYKAENLIVGGFSRGSAFFVPYFLDSLEKFLPNLSSRTSEGKQKDLILYLMDPVIGSKDISESTAQSLLKLKLWDKTRLIKKLKNKGFNLKLIYLSAGFDMRTKRFKIDKSFYDKRQMFSSFFTAKLGLSHSNMSDWSVKASGDVKVKSIRYGNKKNWKWNIENNSQVGDVKQSFSKYSPDVDITQKIMYFLSKNPSSSYVVERAIDDLHTLTEKSLGKQASENKRLISYHIEYIQKFMTNWKLAKHSRLSIAREGTLDALQNE
ncbi:MAG: Unknown protein [uncultured Sulfurovum sp.]|uniref:Uncharacterized protein n=1 Tax=uncultured Sulfurovum sp. TaxID=269237 RepID=A0A6S6UC73_9BACT|nr:MAG: Unknown protein [uncultured Sulfurovum sp.]